MKDKKPWEGVLAPLFLAHTQLITIERIENIAQDIISDDEWVNDSHSKAEHNGIKDGLNRLIKHLKQI